VLECGPGKRRVLSQTPVPPKRNQEKKKSKRFFRGFVCSAEDGPRPCTFWASALPPSHIPAQPSCCTVRQSWIWTGWYYRTLWNYFQPPGFENGIRGARLSFQKTMKCLESNATMSFVTCFQFTQKVRIRQSLLTDESDMQVLTILLVFYMTICKADSKKH
jgi:hypothetical protein